MQTHRHHAYTVYAPAVLFVLVSIGLYLWPEPVHYLRSLIEGHGILSYAVFVSMLFIATVFMPVTVMPIVPVAAPIFGPFTTGVLSIIGWTLGAAAAFGVARWLGRPIIDRFVSLTALDEAVDRIPPGAQFLTIVLIRMALPVDIMSYALGLTRSIRFVPYCIATALGVTWFSFAFAYLGAGVFAQDTILIAAVGASSLVLFCVCWAILIRHTRRMKSARSDSEGEEED